MTKSDRYRHKLQKKLIRLKNQRLGEYEKIKSSETYSQSDNAHKIATAPMWTRIHNIDTEIAKIEKKLEVNQ